MKPLRSKKTVTIPVLLFTLLILPSIINAADIEGPRALAMGGAYSAIAAGPDAIRLNPAGIGLSKIYVIKAGYQSRNDNSRAYNASILDFKTSNSPLGLSYTKEEIAGQERNYGILSFANSGASTLIGLSVKYFEDSTKDKKAYSYDIGILMRQSDDLSISLVGRNLKKTDLDFAHKTYTAGAAYKPTSELTIAADYTKDRDIDSNNTITALGMSYSLSSSLALRAGYKQNEISASDYYSAGLSIFDRNGYLDYGYRWNKDNRDDHIHSVSLSMNH